MKSDYAFTYIKMWYKQYRSIDMYSHNIVEIDAFAVEKETMHRVMNRTEHVWL